MDGRPHCKRHSITVVLNVLVLDILNYKPSAVTPKPWVARTLTAENVQLIKRHSKQANYSGSLTISPLAR